jgi:UDP-N-acetylenolpyruvoylglucosamine reductase
MSEFREARRGQPYGDHSSGCVFRNPPGDFAGRLIDELGLKGFAVGEARVSSAHANFLVNDGEASPEDVVALIEQVRQRVRESRGIELRTEVILVDPDRVEAAS